MTRRKKKWLLLRGKKGNFILGSREWYDAHGIGKHRGRNQMWLIAAQSDDRAALEAMGNLTERFVGMRVIDVTEEG